MVALIQAASRVRARKHLLMRHHQHSAATGSHRTNQPTNKKLNKTTTVSHLFVCTTEWMFHRHLPSSHRHFYLTKYITNRLIADRLLSNFFFNVITYLNPNKIILWACSWLCYFLLATPSNVCTSQMHSGAHRLAGIFWATMQTTDEWLGGDCRL